MTRSTLTGTFRRAALPLGAYYAVTLAIPLANGAAHAGVSFAQHAIVVLVVPLLLVVAAHAMGVVATQILRSSAVSSLGPDRVGHDSHGKDPASKGQVTAA